MFSNRIDIILLNIIIDTIIPDNMGNKNLMFFLGFLKNELMLSNNGSYNFIDIAINDPLTPGKIFPSPIMSPFMNSILSPVKFMV